MNQPVKRIGLWGGVTGITAAVLLACTACCVPLLAPIAAWLGLAGLALLGPYGLAAASLGAAAIGMVMLLRRRRRLACRGCAH
jgi:hypothetical protein